MPKKQVLEGKVEALEVNVVMVQGVAIGKLETLLVFYEDKDDKSPKLQNSMKTAKLIFPGANVLFVPFIRR